MATRTSRPNAWVLLAALLLAAALITGPAGPARAQEATPPSTVQLTSPYLGVAVEPGDTASFNLNVAGPVGEEVALSVADLPEGWTARIRGGGYIVERILISDAAGTSLTLEVDVPEGTPDGLYPVAVAAQGSSTSDRLEFGLNVSETVGGGVSLTAEFPALQGPSDVTFTFTLELANDTADEIQFGLQSQGPEGWQVEARPSGQSRASTVTVAAGSSERITVDVDPPDFTPAAVYPVLVQAAGGGETATTELSVEVTGNFDMTLLTPDERLNVDVEAGTPTDLPLLVVNQGTAPLTDVSLSATPPRGWEVIFTPESIDRVEPGATSEVTATVTPASDAINGDYSITMKAGVAETNDQIEVRATVETSAIWGLVGVAVILIALGALIVVFRRFGRR